MRLVKKVLILEDPVSVRPSGFDHIFSFSSNSADSFPEDYLSTDEAQTLYDETYRALCDWLDSAPFRVLFSYRGVDLLRCFRKPLFDFAHFARLRHETLTRLMERLGQSEFTLEQQGQDSKYPYLSQILKAVPLEGEGRILGLKEIKPSAPIRPSTGESFPWPSKLVTGRIKKAEVVIFSDFEKVKGLLPSIQSHSCVLFSNVWAPRMIFRSFIHGVTLYQIAYNSQQRKIYELQAKKFSHLLNENRIFEGLRLGKLNGEALLGPKLLELFGTSLGQILFEIDQAHQLFQKAGSVKSVLLDEDVLPSQSAFCQVARLYKVQSFVESHGALGHAIGFLPLTADRILVWGNAQKNKLVEWGCPEERILVSGRGRYSEFQKLDPQAMKNKVCKQFGLDPAKKIILLAFPPISKRRNLFEHLWRSIIEEALEAVKNVLSSEPAQFIIKLHPGDQNQDQFEDWVRRNDFQNGGVITRHYEPLILTKASDGVVVYMSTFAVDAFAMQKPVICLRDETTRSLKEFRRFQIFHYANSRSEIEDALRRILKSKESGPARWAEARRECLGEGMGEPNQIIAKYLLNGR